MPRCARCGEESPERARFCLGCGAPLVAAPPERRKLVTLVFCDMSGSTAMGERVDAESVRDMTLRYFSEMREAIERHGGTVEKFIGDAVVAVFGVPVAHEDDAVRAVRAAAEMQARVGKLNDELERRYGSRIAVRIGVNSGEVVAGDASARVALVTGDAVNVAARLEQAAQPGDVLLGEPTYRLVRSAVTAEPVEAIRAKGKAEPVPAYRLRTVASEAAVTRPLRSRMIGRTTELATLEQAFEAAVGERACRLATVVGEPGVGKSRLAAELIDRIGARAATVLRGRCLSYGESITFWPIAEIVRSAAGIADGDDPERARGRLAALIPDADDRRRIADRVGQAIGLIGGSAPAEEIAWAIRKLLEGLARRRPLLLVVDDIHWAEPALLDVLAELPGLVSDAPMLVLCLTRPELLEQRPEWGPVIALSPLRGADAASLVETLLGSSGVPVRVTERIGAAAAGNPLFAEEVVAMLVERGALRRADGGWVATDALEEIDIPPTVGALLEARLDRLPVPVREALERGAVEGQEFHRAALTALTAEAQRASLDRALVTLEGHGLVHAAPSTAAEDQTYRFRHALVRDAAYRGIPKKLRSELHEQLGRWLERSAGRRIAELEEVLAYHLEAAVRYREELGPLDHQGRALARAAGGHLAAAGRRARDRGDVRAAAKLLARAVALLDDDAGARAAALVDLGGAVAETDELARAGRLLGEAIELARSTGDVRTEWRAVVMRAAVRGDAAPDDLDAAERAAAALTAIGDDLGVAQAWLFIGQLRFWMGSAADATEAWDIGLTHARRARSRVVESEILAWALIGSWFGPEPVERGIRRCEEILADGSHHRRTTAQALVEHAVFLAAAGRPDDARAQMASALAIIDDLGLQLLSGIVSQEAIDAEMLAGDPAAAERAGRRGCALLERMGEKGFLASRLGCVAEALYAQGRYEDADELASLLERDGPADDVDVQWRWRAVRAKVRARRGESSGAVALATEAAELLEATDWLNWRGDALLDLSEVLRLTGHRAEAAATADQALALFEAKGNVASARRARALGTLAGLATG